MDTILRIMEFSATLLIELSIALMTQDLSLLKLSSILTLTPSKSKKS